jgi:hypothetical protein
MLSIKLDFTKRCRSNESSFFFHLRFPSRVAICLTVSSHRILETGATSDVPEEPEHLFLMLIASSHRMGAPTNITRASNEVAICSETLTGISNACSLLCRHLTQSTHLPRLLDCATGDGSEGSGTKTNLTNLRDQQRIFRS